MIRATYPHSPDHCDIAQWKNLQGFEVNHQVNSVNHWPEKCFWKIDLTRIGVSARYWIHIYWQVSVGQEKTQFCVNCLYLFAQRSLLILRWKHPQNSHCSLPVETGAYRPRYRLMFFYTSQDYAVTFFKFSGLPGFRAFSHLTALPNDFFQVLGLPGYWVTIHRSHSGC